MLRSMFSGVSGLKSHQMKMDVIGNNIANVNTTGFKASRVTFQDLLNQTIRGASAPAGKRGGSNPIQIGLGVNVASVDLIFTQGGLQYTGGRMDYAIQGDGLFIVSDGSSYYYTRDGAFTMDANGKIVNAATGFTLQGWVARMGVVDTSTVPEDLKIPVGQKLPAKATTEISIVSNLDATAGAPELVPGNTAGISSASGIGGSGAGTYSIVVMADGSLKVNFTSSDGKTKEVSVTVSADKKSATFDGITVNAPDGFISGGVSTITVTSKVHTASTKIYDSRGEAHSLSITFTRVGDNQWTWTASISGIAEIKEGGSGKISFNADGSLADFSYETVGGKTPTSLVIDPKNGADEIKIGITMGLVGSFEGVTQFASPSTASVRSQNGYPMGVLETVSTLEDGTIVGLYSNGQTQPIAKIALANFANPSGLLRSGNNLFSASANSGEPQIGTAGTGGRGMISAGMLELSNVDLAQEFSNLIITQRGFQASSRLITTSDEMLQDLVNLKR